jgi:hypothetical protein
MGMFGIFILTYLLIVLLIVFTSLVVVDIERDCVVYAAPL